MPRMISFKEFRNLPKKIRIEVPAKLLQEAAQLDEATRSKVGRYTARRDPPHFQGDEYHAHADIPGGYEVSWGVSGARRHPNKFPAAVPKDAKQAIANVLKISVDLLETSKVYDEKIGEDVLLFATKAGVGNDTFDVVEVLDRARRVEVTLRDVAAATKALDLPLWVLLIPGIPAESVEYHLRTIQKMVESYIAQNGEKTLLEERYAPEPERVPRAGADREHRPVLLGIKMSKGRVILQKGRGNKGERSRRRRPAGGGG